MLGRKATCPEVRIEGLPKKNKTLKIAFRAFCYVALADDAGAIF